MSLSLFLLSLSPLTTLTALVASLSLPSFPPFLDIDTLPFPFYEYNSNRTWLRTSHTALPVKLWVNQAATVEAGEFIPYLYRPSYAGAAVSNRCRNISSEGFGADVVGGLGLGQRAGAFYIIAVSSLIITLLRCVVTRLSSLCHMGIVLCVVNSNVVWEMLFCH